MVCGLFTLPLVDFQSSAGSIPVFGTQSDKGPRLIAVAPCPFHVVQAPAGWAGLITLPPPAVRARPDRTIAGEGPLQRHPVPPEATDARRPLSRSAEVFSQPEVNMIGKQREIEVLAVPL